MKSITTKRPWGSFTSFTNNELSTVKLLYIKKGEEFSLQYHTHREEHWEVVEGDPEIIIGDKTYEAHEGQEFVVAPHVQHRVYAKKNNVIILEISKGEFDENDIVRIEDKYHREG